MDPDANLHEQRVIANEIKKVWADCCADGTLTRGQREYVAERANRLAELVDALDDWIILGGTLPKDWRRHTA